MYTMYCKLTRPRQEKQVSGALVLVEANFESIMALAKKLAGFFNDHHFSRTYHLPHKHDRNYRQELRKGLDLT